MVPLRFDRQGLISLVESNIYLAEKLKENNYVKTISKRLPWQLTDTAINGLN